MTTQDSWIDPDELDELVGVFSKKKKKKSKAKAKKKAKSAPVARKAKSDDRRPKAKRKKSSKKVKSAKSGGASKGSPISVEESADTVAISSIDDLDSYLEEEDSPPPLVFGGESDSSPEVVQHGEDADDKPRAEVIGDVEAEITDEPEEEEEALIAPEGGAVVFVSNESDDGDEMHHPAAFEIDSEFGTKEDEESESDSVEPDYSLDESSFEDTSSDGAEPEDELAADEEPREMPLYDGGLQDRITVDSEDEDFSGSANPGLLSEEPEAEEDTTKKDAEKAVKALAEARAEAESAELINLRKWASIEEEPPITSDLESGSGEWEEHGDDSETFDLLDGGEKGEESDLITVYEEDERSIEGEANTEEMSVPLPEFQVIPSATMVERVAGYADFLRKGIQAKSIVIRDERGFLIYDDGGERKLSAASFETVRTLRKLNGSEGGLFSQIRLTESEWLCVISSRGAEGDLFTQLVIGEPVRPSRLVELANTLSKAIFPSKAA